MQPLHHRRGSQLSCASSSPEAGSDGTEQGWKEKPKSSWKRPRRWVPFLLVLVGVASAATYLTMDLSSSMTWKRIVSSSQADPAPSPQPVQPPPPDLPWRHALLNRTIAVYDNNTWHDEVQGSVLETLSQFEGLSGIKVYKSGWRWGFGKLLEGFWDEGQACLDPFMRRLDDDAVLDQPGNFWSDIRIRASHEATDPSGRKMITDLILTTCDGDILGRAGEALRQEWEGREPEERFRILCVRHGSHEGETRGSDFFLRRGAITHLGLGEHTTEMYRQHIVTQNPLMSSHIPPAAETYIPIFQPSGLDDLPPLGAGSRRGKDRAGQNEFEAGHGGAIGTSRMIDSAAMQGNLGEDHRDTKKTLDELFAFIRESPGLWGYKNTSSPEEEYLPLSQDPASRTAISSFQLHLVGHFLPSVPPAFKHVVIKHAQLDYIDYVRVLNGADVMLTAFPEGSEYLTIRASSTVGVAGTVRTALMTDEKTANAYGWFTSEFEVRREANMTEMEYIHATRTGQIEFDRRLRSPGNLRRRQEMWQQANGRLFAQALNRPFMTGEEDWETYGQ